MCEVSWGGQVKLGRPYMVGGGKDKSWDAVEGP